MPIVITEFVGTFFLVLTIGLSVLSGTPMAPLAIGAMLMVMVYMGGHVSGGHYNPAVTLGLAVAGKVDKGKVLVYWLSQFAGAVVASFTVQAILGKTFAPAPGEGVSVLGAYLVEILFTFALVLVVLNVATSDKTKGNSFYGLAIGFTVAAAALAGGGVSGGAFNPAVGFGPTLVHALAGVGGYGHLLLYFVGPTVGGVLAAVVFRMQGGGR